MNKITIRSAQIGEADALSALCFRSKAHWGYDEQFMALSRASLTISPSFIADDRVLVDGDGALLGMASVARLPEPGDFDLAHMFVEHHAIRSGVGRMLFLQAARKAKADGAQRLVIQSDPHAAAFYRLLGAIDAGDAPSESIPGRRLPVLHYALA